MFRFSTRSLIHQFLRVPQVTPTPAWLSKNPSPGKQSITLATMSFTWVKPKASSGKKVPKAELARSMGIDEEAYDTILVTT